MPRAPDNVNTQVVYTLRISYSIRWRNDRLAFTNSKLLRDCYYLLESIEPRAVSLKLRNDSLIIYSYARRSFES